MATYIYNKKVNASRLQDEIKSNSSITKDLDFITFHNETIPEVIIEFTSSLSGAEETVLSSLISAHQAGSGIAQIKKYKVTETLQGRTLKVRWYATDNGDGTYLDLAEELIYSYNANKLESISLNVYDTSGALLSPPKVTYFYQNNLLYIEKPGD